MAYINNKPHVNFELNKEMDYWTVKEFLIFDPVNTFTNTMLELHPKLKETQNLDSEARTTFCKNYIDQIYEAKSTELNNIRDDIQESWNKVESDFLKKTQELFNKHTWPKGAYVGFLSIFNCNPRFLDQKTFQVYYKHPEGPVYVCVHEMLHFMFYDYLEKHPNLTQGADDSDIWKLSEIFNIVILETPKFVEITNNPNPKPYKSHEAQIPKFRKLWKDIQNVSEFIERAFTLL